jgi:hypothetical protein
VTRRVLTPRLLQWFGVFGAPFAWATQHVAGFALTQAACGRTGLNTDVPVDSATTVISAVAAVVALCAGAAAVASYAGTRDADDDDAPPDGRRHFLAIIGMAVTPLFLAMILMSGSGVLDLPECHQS